MQCRKRRPRTEARMVYTTIIDQIAALKNIIFVVVSSCGISPLHCFCAILAADEGFTQAKTGHNTWSVVALCAAGFIGRTGIRLVAFKSSPVFLICNLHQFLVMVLKIHFGPNAHFFTSCTRSKTWSLQDRNRHSPDFEDQAHWWHGKCCRHTHQGYRCPYIQKTSKGRVDGSLLWNQPGIAQGKYPKVHCILSNTACSRSTPAWYIGRLLLCLATYLYTSRAY